MAPYTEYTYSPLDLLTNVTDDAGNTTDMTYDSLGRKLKMGDPDMGVWYYGYDANGQLVSQRDARGWPTTFTYDALGRLTSKFSTSDATFSDAFSCFTCFSGSAILPLGQAALRRHHPDQHQLHRPAAGRHRAVVLSCADVRPKPGAGGSSADSYEQGLSRR